MHVRFKSLLSFFTPLYPSPSLSLFSFLSPFPLFFLSLPHVVPASLAEHGAQTFYCLLMAALSIIRDQSLRANEPGHDGEEIAGNKKQKKSRNIKKEKGGGKEKGRKEGGRRGLKKRKNKINK